MAEFPTPEIIRTSLQELCLYARSFIRGELKIGDFFNRLPEPPAPIAVKKAVDILKAMEAIDENEHMTYLGMYLLDLPVEPSLGKALIFAVILSCLDPILTIISMISYR
jgi:HrpA-like RNA helicase